MSSPLYWLGIRESEIAETGKLFAGSITIFGSGQKTNRAFERAEGLRYDYNQDNEAWVEFAAAQAREIVHAEPDCRFLLYAPEDAQYYGPEVKIHALNGTPPSLTELLSDKFRTRQWLSEYVPILPYQMLSGASISYSDLCRSFRGSRKYVVQHSHSCGGSGTWLLTQGGELLDRLYGDAMYSVSPYMEHSISPNIHMVIDPHTVKLLPPSVQLIEAEAHGLCYKGADYPMYGRLPKVVDEKLREYALRIGRVLREAGYRGVCGIDFLISEGEVYLMEINARFQSSTFLLNRAMSEAGIGTSVQKLHLDALSGEIRSELPEALNVPYSFYHYTYRPEYEPRLRYIHNILQGALEVDCVDDDLDWNMPMEPGTYAFKAVFHGSIAVPTSDGGCRLHGNVGLPAEAVKAEALKGDIVRLKHMLLAHGVRMSKTVESRLREAGGFNHEEFSALDLLLNGRIFVCAPYEANRSELSPFCIEAGPESAFILSWYGEAVADVQIRRVDSFGEMQTASGLIYHKASYLSNDRLRIYHRSGCFFKDCGKGCGFCDIEESSDTLELKDIFHILDTYRDHPAVRHYMIGGGSAAPNDDFSNVIQIARYIRDTTGKPIYLMSLPPCRPEMLSVLKEAGVSEVSFNLEVFDRDLAKKYMPGKGAIPLSIYRRAFQSAVELWGREGNVRTIFIVGLEPKESLLRGVEYVANLGVAPILALFRPIPGTPMENMLPPSDDEIQEIYWEANKICCRCGVEMGPKCRCCEDNTLKITL